MERISSLAPTITWFDSTWFFFFRVIWKMLFMNKNQQQEQIWLNEFGLHVVTYHGLCYWKLFAIFEKGFNNVLRLIVTFLNKIYRFGPKGFYWTNTPSVRGKEIHVNQAPQRETPRPWEARELSLIKHLESWEARGLTLIKHLELWEPRGLTLIKHLESWEARGLTLIKHLESWEASRLTLIKHLESWEASRLTSIKHPKGNRKLLRPRRCSWVMLKVVLKWNHLFLSKSLLWSTFRP